jgi:hypothetical protein
MLSKNYGGGLFHTCLLVLKHGLTKPMPDGLPPGNLILPWRFDIGLLKRIVLIINIFIIVIKRS